MQKIRSHEWDVGIQGCRINKGRINEGRLYIYIYIYIYIYYDKIYDIQYTLVHTYTKLKELKQKYMIYKFLNLHNSCTEYSTEYFVQSIYEYSTFVQCVQLL